MDQDKFFDKIEAYLGKNLSDTDRQEFEQMLEQDPHARKLFERYRGAWNLLQESASLRLKERMQDLEKKQKVISRWRDWRTYAGIAASLLVLGIAYVWLSRPGKLENSEILKVYFEPYPARLFRGQELAIDPLKKGMEYYELREYEAAISSFQKLLPDDGRYLEAQFYMSNCFLNEKEYLKAIEILKDICEKGDARFSEAGCWYLLLSYVGANQIQPFKALAKNILDGPPNAYKGKIEELQRKWENL